MYICPEVLREPAGAHVPLAVLRRAGGLAGDASVWQTNRKHVCIYICIYTCIHICVYIYIYICIYIYRERERDTHTCLHTRGPSTCRRPRRSVAATRMQRQPLLYTRHIII